jgi:hypothetical protein
MRMGNLRGLRAYRFIVTVRFPQLLDQAGQDGDDAVHVGPVFDSPRLKRMDPSVRAWGRPMAFNTCEGSRVPDEHADRTTPRCRRGQADQQRLRLDALDADVRRVRHARLGDAVPVAAGHRSQHAALETVAQRRQARPLGCHLLA